MERAISPPSPSITPLRQSKRTSSRPTPDIMSCRPRLLRSRQGRTRVCPSRCLYLWPHQRQLQQRPQGGTRHRSCYRDSRSSNRRRRPSSTRSSRRTFSMWPMRSMRVRERRIQERRGTTERLRRRRVGMQCLDRTSRRIRSITCMPWRTRMLRIRWSPDCSRRSCTLMQVSQARTTLECRGMPCRQGRTRRALSAAASLAYFTP